MGTVARVRLLGGFEVELDGRLLPDAGWRRRRAAALVKLLALAPGHRLPRDTVMEALWPGLGPGTAAANLRKAAHHARQVLAAEAALVLDGATVQLLPGAAVDTDVARFESAAREALRHGDVDRSREVAARYPGDLLPEDLYEPWCAEPRERLRSRYRDLLVAGRLWGRLLELDPASELAHRGIVAERLAAGDRAGAIRQFDRMRTVLREELGVSPDRESVALYERVLAADGRDVPTPVERARALLAWGVVHWERSELDEAERTAVEVRALAVDAGLGRELADASELLGLVAYAQGRWREVFAREFLDAVTGRPELAPFVLDANICMSEFAVHEADGVDAVAAFAEELLTASAASGSDQARALGLLLRGEVELLSGGDPARAGADLTESARLHTGTASATGVTLATERLAQTEMLQGRPGSAWQLHRRARELALGSPIPNHLLPLVYGGMLDAADPETGVSVLADAVASLSDMRPCDPCSMPFHLGASVLCAHSGEHGRAREHLDEAARIAAMWRTGPWHAAVAEAWAVLRRAEGGGTAEARASLETAVRGFTAARRRRDAARCRAALTALG